MILYTIDCPACKVLEKKLITKNIPFNVCKDITEFERLKITTFPVLQIDENSLLQYSEAVKWVNNYEGDN